MGPPRDCVGVWIRAQSAGNFLENVSDAVISMGSPPGVLKRSLWSPSAMWRLDRKPLPNPSLPVPAERALLLRHLLGLRHGGDGVRGDEVRRPAQAPVPKQWEFYPRKVPWQHNAGGESTSAIFPQNKYCQNLSEFVKIGKFATK